MHKCLAGWLLRRSTFQFKRQLIHVGLLASEPAFAGAMGNYVAGWVAGFLENRPFSEVFMIAFVTSSVATLILAVLIPVIRKLMGGVR